MSYFTNFYRRFISGKAMVLCIGLFALTSHANVQAQTVINPGFETGNTSGWLGGGAVYGVNNQNPQSGSYNAYNNGSYNLIYQDVSGFSPNTQYTLRAWGKLSGANDNSQFFYVSNSGGAYAAGAIRVSITSTTYQQYAITFTTGTNTTVQIGQIQWNSGNVAAYSDNYSIVQGTGAPTPTPTPTPTPSGGTGSITREFWKGIGGTSVAAIPVSTTPSSTGTLTSFEAPTNVDDNYGQRVRGFLTAPTTGSYTFWIASDDNSELWLSPNDQSSSKVKIAQVTTWTNSREWTREAGQKSAAINLTAGQKYYIEALMKEGSGGDNLAVGWAKPGQSTSSPGEIIPGSVLSPISVGTPTPTATPTPNTSNAIGINTSFASDSDAGMPFADAIETSRQWGLASGPWNGSVPVDTNGWPTGDAATILVASLKNIHGTYRISFTGNANIATVACNGTVQNKIYNASTNTTTADLVVTDANQDFLCISFTGQSGGVKNVKVMRPVSPGSSTSYSTSTTFTNQYKSLISKFSAIRFMDWTSTNGNQVANWSDRTPPTYAQQGARTFGTDPNGNLEDAGVAWENCIQLANELDKDVWINVPLKASNDYVTQLATLFKNNLEPDRKIYIEYSNELWNTGYGFSQGNQNKDLAVAEVNGGGSPLNFDGSANQWEWAWRRVGKRTKEISDIFRTVFGDGAMMSRVRPVLQWQQANGQATAENTLRMIDYLAAQNGRAVNYYIYAGGGSAYYNPDNGSDNLTLDNIWSSQTFNVSNWYPSLATDTSWCATFGVRRMAYEGGPSMDNSGHSESIKAAAVNDSRMKQLLIDHHNAWSNYGGDLLMYYQATGNYQWGFTNDINNLNTPKIQAIDALNSAARAPITYASTAPVTFQGAQFTLANPTWRSQGTGSTSLNAASDGGQWASYVFRVTNSGNRTVSVSTNASAGQLQLSIDGQVIANQTSATVAMQPGLHSVRIRPLSGSFDVNNVSIN